MKSESLTQHATTSTGRRYVSYNYAHRSNSSPRGADGRLKFRANDWSLQVYNCKIESGRTDKWSRDLLFEETTRGDPKITRAINIAESDLRGALARAVRSNVAAGLGVSLASAKQSMEMFRGAATTLGNIFLSVERFYRTTRGKKRLKRFRRLIAQGAEPTAGKVLEGFFGWQPAIEDMYAAAEIASNPYPPLWVSRKKKFTVNGTIASDFNGVRSRTQWTATGHSTYATEVAVTNPNLWVANRLGLINVVGIAWDLVPWSFLVNMVSNLGQIAGSLTDFAGLTLRNSSLTRHITLTQSGQQTWSEPSIPPRYAWSKGSSTEKFKVRVAGAPIPTVTPYLRLPSLGVGLAAIAGALLVQNTKRVSSVLGLSS